MIYRTVDPKERLSQGDIIDGCPILSWEVSSSKLEGAPKAVELEVRVVVLTQACDLAQEKASRVVVAVLHSARTLVDEGILKANVVEDLVRTHRVYGWYFLPAGPHQEESVVDLRDLHTIPRPILERLIRQGKRLSRIDTPYREHLAQHFSITYSRIGLPEPYETEK